MLRSPELDQLISDIAEGFNEQFRYIPNAPVESQAVYEVAIKDATIAIAAALHKNIVDFHVDSFYARAGYPGTHPVHQRTSSERR